MKCDLCLKVNTFNLKYTLECGQCFRWKQVEENTFIGVIQDRVIKIKQAGDMLYIWSNEKGNLEQVIKHYFDLNTDYAKIEKDIAKIDENINLAVKYSTGIRILNQPLFETIISYIISANNNIKRISRSVNEISKMFGTKVEFEGEEYYLFPTLDQLASCTNEQLLKCGLGFRARYVVHDVEEFIAKPNIIKNLENMTTKEAQEVLLQLMGIGPKVADCIMLFALRKREVFPVDVWVKRIMEKLYFKKNTSLKTIREYAKENYGKNSGIIQQHLFYNVREGKL